MLNMLFFIVGTVIFFGIWRVMHEMEGGASWRPFEYMCRIALSAFLFIPFNFGGNVFTILGNGSSERDFYSVASLYQDAGSNAFSCIGIGGYQKAGDTAGIFLGTAVYQKAGQKAIMGPGIVGYQKAGQEVVLTTGVAGYQKSDERAQAILGTAVYQSVGEQTRWFGTGFALQAESK